MTQPKLQVKNCDLFYGDFQALKNINLSIAEKEITAFIGPSGCGKSTLLKSLNRMNDLVEGCKITGDFTLDGENTELRTQASCTITSLQKTVMATVPHIIRQTAQLYLYRATDFK